MDAPLRRLPLLLLPLLALSGAGCGLLDRSTDKKVSDLLRDERPQVPAVTRGQLPPLPPPPVSSDSKPVLPVAEKPSAPIIPVELPTELPSVSIPPANEPTSKSTVSGPVTLSSASAVEARTAPRDTRVKVVATVGADSIITDEEVSLLMKQRAMEYLALKGDERDQKEKEIYKDCVRMLVERELILCEFLSRVKKAKPAALDELWEQAARSADLQFRDMRTAFKAKKLNTEADLAKELEAQGMPYKQFRRQVERAAMVQMYIGPMLREKHGNPTLVQVQDYYTRNKAEFRTEDKVKFLHLFVSHSRFNSPAEAKAAADGLFKQALGGADFVALVKKHGHGDSPLRDGAGIGEKRGEIQPSSLEETVLSLKAGNISAVVPTETGYHIVKVIERQVAGVRPFDEKMQTDIRNKLIDQAAKAERDKIVSELWRKIGVTILDR
jgi:peptidyl-prolyl cis-trans isomerase SurA